MSATPPPAALCRHSIFAVNLERANTLVWLTPCSGCVLYGFVDVKQINRFSENYQNFVVSVGVVAVQVVAARWRRMQVFAQRRLLKHVSMNACMCISSSILLRIATVVVVDDDVVASLSKRIIRHIINIHTHHTYAHTRDTSAQQAYAGHARARARACDAQQPRSIHHLKRVLGWSVGGRASAPWRHISHALERFENIQALAYVRLRV